MSTSTTSSTSASPAELRQQMQSVSLEHLRNRLANVDLRDLVPFLVARHVLRSHEMGAVYSKKSKQKMSSSAKRVQKLRQGQSEEERKAELARNAQWKRDKRAAAKNAKIKDPQQRDQKTPHESSSLSLGVDDSGFDTKNSLLKGSLFAQHDNRDSQFSCGDAANILNTLQVYHCSLFAQHDNRDSQFSCGDAANMLYTLHVFHYIDIQNVSYQLRFKRLRAYFSKPGQVDQLNEFIEILKTKNHWMGPVIDCLIRNGQTAIAEELMRQKT